jgi:hypothetical protein
MCLFLGGRPAGNSRSFTELREELLSVTQTVIELPQV